MKEEALKGTESESKMQRLEASNGTFQTGGKFSSTRIKEKGGTRNMRQEKYHHSDCINILQTLLKVSEAKIKKQKSFEELFKLVRKHGYCFPEEMILDL